MDCVVHGITKSQTELRGFHFTSLLQVPRTMKKELNYLPGAILLWKSHWTLSSESCIFSYHSFCCSVSQSYPTLCDPRDCRTPGFPVLHHLLELAYIHVHGIGQDHLTCFDLSFLFNKVVDLK